jgi:hypothetical protein
VIKAELASAAVPLHIWRRSRQCLDLTLEESRLACAPVLGLRKELAAAEAAERLEAQLVAGRTQLATASVAGSVVDPQASALARLIGADEGTIRTGIAVLLAGLVEVGSALGFTLVSMATARNTQPPSTIKRVAGSSDTAGPRGEAPRSTRPQALEHRVQTRHRAAHNRLRRSCTSCQLAGPSDTAPLPSSGAVPGSQVKSNPQSSSRSDPLDRWIETRLNMDPAGSIPARDAYADFCRWARASGIEPCTETRFGRGFTARIIHLGGVKIKRRDRSYYVGVVSQDSQCVGTLALRADPRPAGASSRPPWEWTYATPLAAG